MTTAAPATDAPAPALDAERSLRRVLDLIRDGAPVGAITAARLRGIFGVEFTESSGRYGFAERLTQDWWSSFELDPKAPHGPRFEFAFRPAAPNAHPPASAICALDYEGFAAELLAMGFRHETYRAEHNRIVHERFERPGMIVLVYTRGEADTAPDKIAHACVQRVLIS